MTSMTALAHPPESVRIRKCDHCGDQMQHLGDLPKTARYTPLSVFRCCRCNSLMRESWQAEGA
jgi:hypothetical protein